MLDTITKRRIDTARDILVGKLPDPKSQVEQITIALIYKFMDDMDKQAEELGGETTFFTGEYEKYSWSKIFDPRVSGYNLVGLYGEAIQKMNHNPNIPQLFRDIFKNAYLPYRDPETLKMFLKVIGEFEYDHSEKLGDAFEYLLSIMGSQGDAGQFRTPRHIIDFMVEVVDPCKNETVLDPACGTAGFLISSFNHILNKNKKDNRLSLTADERTRLISNFSGYDISPDMVRLSLVNMYLHKFPAPKIYEYDTLASEEKWNEFYDIILANPPFMSPTGGIKPHKRFSIQAKRSEVLFVDYIAEHLNPNGRGGVIVPEGIIFQSGIAYKKLRKMLIENSLYAVVSLPAGVFNPYSSVKTSILFLNKNLAKKNDKILFVKVNNDGFGLGAQRREVKENDLPMALEIIKKYKQSIIEGKEIEFNLAKTKLAHLVKKEKIAESGDYNLSGDRYKEAAVYGGKWDFVELGKVCEVYQPKTISQKEMKEDGEYLVFGANGIIGRFNKYNHEKAEVLITCRGATCGTVNMSEPKSWITGNAMVIKPKDNNFNKKYLFYLLKHSIITSTISGSAQPQITRQDLSPFKIPFPPIEIQEQIVAELDNYQKIIDGAKQVVENYKPTFKIDPEWEKIRISEVMLVNSETVDPKRKYGKNKFVYIDISSVGNETGIVSFTNKLEGNKAPSRARRVVKKGDILLSTVRPNLKAFGFLEEVPDNVIASTGFAVLSATIKVEPLFVYFQLFSDFLQEQMISRMGKGSYPSINQKDVQELKILYPPLDIQQKIAFQLKKEQKIVNANKELITIFENKIKDKIADVWGEKKQI